MKWSGTEGASLCFVGGRGLGARTRRCGRGKRRRTQVVTYVSRAPKRVEVRSWDLGAPKAVFAADYGGCSCWRHVSSGARGALGPLSQPWGAASIAIRTLNLIAPRRISPPQTAPSPPGVSSGEGSGATTSLPSAFGSRSQGGTDRGTNRDAIGARVSACRETGCQVRIRFRLKRNLRERFFLRTVSDARWRRSTGGAPSSLPSSVLRIA